MLEFIAMAVIAVLTGRVARAVHVRRSHGRAARSQAGAMVEVPCRVSWRRGLGRRAFVYGKLSGGEDGALFARPVRRPVPLPVGGSAVTSSSWRPGMQVLDYRTHDGDELRILHYEDDVELVVRYLRCAEIVGR
ncbi:hypothetical protein ACH5AL_34035 [Actinacidiphila glaucinigra]|uniref:hypothetical protein n=1 Tax=Actinacidiphila glaucinigra TaxID=235986 RepID=UPI003797D419